MIIYLVAEIEPSYGDRIIRDYGYFSDIKLAKEVLEYHRNEWLDNGWALEEAERHIVFKVINIKHELPEYMR